MIDDATDPLGISDPTEKARQKRAAELHNDALRSILNTRNGRRFLHGHMKNNGVDGVAFTGDNNITNYNFGRQSVATDLKADIAAINGEALILMLREAKEDENYVNGSTQSDADTNDYDPTA